MPKQARKRGRRENKRRKLDIGWIGPTQAKSDGVDEVPVVTFGPSELGSMSMLRVPDVEVEDEYRSQNTKWSGYVEDLCARDGVLDEREQDYYKEVSNTLLSGEFESPEGRDIFVRNVFRESDGKELKLACSQSCSKLLERLIALSPPNVLKNMFQKFSGNFINLVSHRFASHCCEAMFQRAAEVIIYACNDGDDLGEIEISTLENLVLFTVGELAPHVDRLLWDRFASHPVRMLLVLLAGRDCRSMALRSIVHGKKKEASDITPASHNLKTEPFRPVPESFSAALGDLLSRTHENTSVDESRRLSLDCVGGPALQLIVEIEASSKAAAGDAERTVQKLLFLPCESGAGESAGSHGFIRALIQDSVGSRLLETILQYSSKKTFARIFTTFIKGNVVSFCEKEPANYVMLVMFRIAKGKVLSDILKEIGPEIPHLVACEKVGLITALVESCKDENASQLANIDKCISEPFIQTGCGSLLLDILKLSCMDKADHIYDREDIDTLSQSSGFPQRCILVQRLLEIQSQNNGVLYDCILSLPRSTLVAFCEHVSLSHVIEKSLVLKQEDPIYKRKLFGLLKGSFAHLASDPCGSHVVDAFLAGNSAGMKIYLERIANELLSSESIVRGSFFGRKVWRNWQMDPYKKSRTISKPRAS